MNSSNQRLGDWVNDVTDPLSPYYEPPIERAVSRFFAAMGGTLGHILDLCLSDKPESRDYWIPPYRYNPIDRGKDLSYINPL